MKDDPSLQVEPNLLNKSPSASAGMGEPVAWRETMTRRIELARQFIASEYTDPSQMPNGDWIAKVAKPAHDALCLCLDALAHPETPVHSGGANIDLANKLSGRLDLDVRDWAWHRLTNAEIALIVAALLNPVAHPPLTVPDDGGGELVQPSIADGGQCKEQQPHAPSDLSK